MLNQYSIPTFVNECLVSEMPEPFKLRCKAMTTEELFYVSKLVQFRCRNASAAMFYLQLQVRAKRFLLGKDIKLFTQAEWELLSRMWKLDFVQYCLKQMGEVNTADRE